MNTSQLGTLGEVRVMLELSKLGLPVFREISNTSKTDIITIVNGKCVKIQCKCINFEINDTVTIQLISATSKEVYTKNDFDIIAIYLPFLEKVIYADWNDIENRKNLSFRYKEGNGKQKNNKNIRYIDSYLDFYRFFEKEKGVVVQLAEHLPVTEEVAGSNPVNPATSGNVPRLGDRVSKTQ